MNSPLEILVPAMTAAGHFAIDNQFCEGQIWQLLSRDEMGDVRRTFSFQNEEALRENKELPTKIAQYRGYLVRDGTRLLQRHMIACVEGYQSHPAQRTLDHHQAP